MKNRIVLFQTHSLCVIAVILSVVTSAGAEPGGATQPTAVARAGTGVAEPAGEVVRAKRAGTVVALMVKPGDVVSKDQVMGHTELDAAKLNVDTARANLDATGTLDQMFWQYQAFTVAREETEDAVRKHTVAKSRLQYAINMEKWAKSQFEAQQDLKKVQKIQFEYHQNEYDARFFHAPADGVVTAVKVAVGQAVGIGTVVITVSNESAAPVPATVALEAGKPSLRPK